VPLQLDHFDLVVAVANVAYDGVVLQLLHMPKKHGLEATSGRSEDVIITNEGFEGHAWNPTHESLKYAHRITLRGQDAGPSTAHGQGTVLADVAVTTKGGARLLQTLHRLHA
jgi:hypothetical protein